MSIAAAILIFCIVAAGPIFPQESPNTYYAYPFSIGAGYLPFSPVGSIERQAEVNELSVRIRVPLRFSPVFQPFLIGGLAAVDADGQAEPTVLGGSLNEGASLPSHDPRDTWDHQE